MRQEVSKLEERELGQQCPEGWEMLSATVDPKPNQGRKWSNYFTVVCNLQRDFTEAQLGRKSFVTLLVVKGS